MASATRRRTRDLVEQGQQTRDSLLDIAIDLFGRYGYRGCSLAQIATEAGVVQSALLYHFGSKEKLLMTALLEHYPVESPRADVDAVAAGRSTFADEIVRTTEASAENPSLVRFFSVMSGESLTESHPAHDYFITRYAWIRATFTDAVMSGASLPAAARPAVLRLVTTAFATMDGLQSQWLREPAIDLPAGVRDVARSFNAGLAELH